MCPFLYFSDLRQNVDFSFFSGISGHNSRNMKSSVINQSIEINAYLTKRSYLFIIDTFLQLLLCVGQTLQLLSQSHLYPFILRPISSQLCNSGAIASTLTKSQLKLLTTVGETESKRERVPVVIYLYRYLHSLNETT